MSEPPSLTEREKQITSQDEEMLSMILSQAIHGEDIATRFPEYFQKLHKNLPLRTAFLDALNSLEASLTGGLEPLPEPSSRDLQFLQTIPPTPSIELSVSEGWRVTWFQTVRQLQNILMPPALSEDAAYRYSGNYLAETTYPLFRSDLELPNVDFTALLEAIQSPEDPEMLRVILSVATSESEIFETGLSNLRAHLQWGSYEATVPCDQLGQASFPAIPLAAILDEEQKSIISDLKFVLESSS